MMRRLLRPGIWAAPIGLLWAATASASSITTYGSIVLSTLGTDGMSTNVTDVATQPAAPPAVTDSAATIGGNAPVSNLAPIMGGSTRSGTPGSGGGGSGGGSTPAPAPTTPATAGTGVSDGVPASDNSEPVPIADDVVKPEVEVTINPDGTITETPTSKEEVPVPPIDTALPEDPVTAPVVPVDGEIVTTAVPDSTFIDEIATNETPEPATLTLLGLAGVGGLWHSRRRRK